MDCERIREAISARIDGEDTGIPIDALDAHLADCAACRAWQHRAHEVTRRVRIGGPVLARDLTSGVLAAVAAAPAGRALRRAQRAGLAAVAMAQLAVTVPLLLFGHDHDAGTHAAHELGAFNLALAIAFALGAARPRLSAGLCWPSCAAAAGLLGTALADLIGGQTPGLDELPHLVVVAGAALLAWQARAVGGGAAEPVAVEPVADPGASVAETVTARWLDGSPRRPGGGTGAARENGSKAVA
jgi:predicted anti-sigma-YlaC factor YlaD